MNVGCGRPPRLSGAAGRRDYRVRWIAVIIGSGEPP